MMKLYIYPSELNISREEIPEYVVDNMLKYHCVPMSRVRHRMGVSVTASQRSGYRPKWWELKRGRDGGSQHCYLPKPYGKDKIGGKGATDWTCYRFRQNKDEFLALIIEETSYTRIAVYRNFIHCDYKPTPSGRREIYSSNSSSRWKLKNVI